MLARFMRKLLEQINNSNFHYTRGITPKRVTSGGVHLLGLAPRQPMLPQRFLARRRGFIFPEAFRLTLVKGIVRIKNVELRPLIKARREKREVVSDWTKSVDQSKTEALVRDFQRVDKLLVAKTLPRLPERSHGLNFCSYFCNSVSATRQTRVRRTSSTCLITNSLPPKSSFCPTVSISAYHPPP